MSKFITLTSAKIEGETKPEVTAMGKVCINVDEIQAFWDIFDKYDCKIEKVIIVKSKSNESWIVLKNFDEFEEELRQLTFS